MQLGTKEIKRVLSEMKENHSTNVDSDDRTVADANVTMISTQLNNMFEQVAGNTPKDVSAFPIGMVLISTIRGDSWTREVPLAACS